MVEAINRAEPSIRENRRDLHHVRGFLSFQQYFFSFYGEVPIRESDGWIDRSERGFESVRQSEVMSQKS